MSSIRLVRRRHSERRGEPPRGQQRRLRRASPRRRRLRPATGRAPHAPARGGRVAGRETGRSGARPAKLRRSRLRLRARGRPRTRRSASSASASQTLCRGLRRRGRSPRVLWSIGSGLRLCRFSATVAQRPQRRYHGSSSGVNSQMWRHRQGLTTHGEVRLARTSSGNGPRATTPTQLRKNFQLAVAARRS